MNRFYFDTEYSNGNYYLGDIFEIAVLSEKSGYIFHSYIKIPQPLSPFIMQFCHVTRKKLDMLSLPFNQVMRELIDFIDQESTTTSDEAAAIIIIGHGALLTDFPLLIANCIKNSFDYTPFTKYVFVDSMIALKSKGYTNPGLDTFNDTMEKRHSAIQDVKLLRNVVNKLLVSDISQLQNTMTDILRFLHKKLPITFAELYNLSSLSQSLTSFESTLYEIMRMRGGRKTSLNERQVCNIARYYYKYR